MIRVFEVRVVDEDGSQLGVMRTADALRLAQERGLDLVEVAPLASPPVARLLDFGQYKYELTKREKEAKRKQRSITFKEVRLKPKIGVGDFDTKVRRAIEFLEEGDRVKIAVQFRGRELTHPQIGRDLLDKFAEQIKEHGVVERLPCSKASRCTSAWPRLTSRRFTNRRPARPRLTPGRRRGVGRGRAGDR
jgi:translation initiation factor IF-3